jgi:hypothetical protein
MENAAVAKIETPQEILNKFFTGDMVCNGGNNPVTQALKMIEYAQMNTAKNMGASVLSPDFTPNQQKAIDAFTEVIGGGIPEGDAKSYLFAMASMTCFIAGRAFQQSIAKAPEKETDKEDLFKAIEKIDEGHYGSAKNFVERFINSTPNNDRPRAAVRWFADQMEKKLKENDHKGGWGNMSFDELYLRMKKEAQELLAADMMHKSPETIIGESADTANFCLMIADLHANKFGK